MARFDPLRELGALRSEMNHLMERLSRGTDPGAPGIGWMPSMDLYEDDHSFVLEADLPGLSREDIELHLENRTLTLRGERRPEKGYPPENFHQTERESGRFARSFILPQPIDSEKISATYQNGVLTVILPKAEEVRPRSIPISSV